MGFPTLLLTIFSLFISVKALGAELPWYQVEAEIRSELGLRKINKNGLTGRDDAGRACRFQILKNEITHYEGGRYGSTCDTWGKCSFPSLTKGTTFQISVSEDNELVHRRFNIIDQGSGFFARLLKPPFEIYRRFFNLWEIGGSEYYQNISITKVLNADAEPEVRIEIFSDSYLPIYSRHCRIKL